MHAYKNDYRPEIDGLRAIAVSLVILCHAGFKGFEGGFVGVDVFFVISGYLITKIALNDVAQGNFSISNFYERRARRILPALYLILISCIPFAWIWMLPRDFQDFWMTVTTTSLFSSNIFFVGKAGYFENALKSSPLLHTWSLAVEEQFYLVFPILIYLTKRFGYSASIAFLTFVFISSLIASSIGSLTHPIPTFFLLPTRAWELALGALLAFYLPRIENSISPTANQTLSFLGLSLIITSNFIYTEHTPFPSIYTLLPTVGAVLIITSGRTGTATASILQFKPIVGLGLISYSAYLWHHPIFAFVRYRSLQPPSQEIFAILCFVVLVLAVITWRYVEIPFRSKSTLGKMRFIQYSVSLTACFVLMGFIGHVLIDKDQQRDDVAEIKNIAQANAQRFDCSKDNPGLSDENLYCGVTNYSDDTTTPIAVFGDSHMAAMLPAFETIKSETGGSLIHLGLPGCPPLLDVDVVKRGNGRGNCQAVSQAQYNFVKTHKAKKVFLIARWSIYTNPPIGSDIKTRFFLTDRLHKTESIEDSRKVFEHAIRSTVSKYREIGADVFFIEQLPEHRASGRHLYRHLKEQGLLGTKEAKSVIKNASVTHSSHDGHHEYYRAIVRATQKDISFTAINFDRVFCGEDGCSIGNELEAYYEDGDHVNKNGAKLLAENLKPYL